MLVTVPDGCYRRNLLVTSFRYRWQIWALSPTRYWQDLFKHKRQVPTFEECHQQFSSIRVGSMSFNFELIKNENFITITFKNVQNFELSLELETSNDFSCTWMYIKMSPIWNIFLLLAPVRHFLLHQNQISILFSTTNFPNQAKCLFGQKLPQSLIFDEKNGQTRDSRRECLGSYIN